MNSIMRWDPFREMLTMRNAMDRMFENALVNPDRWMQETEWNLALDVTENDKEYTVKASLPGIQPDALDITYDNNTLTIKGEVKAEEEQENQRVHLRERRYGCFSRSVTLPTVVQSDAIQADYEAGVLTLHLPKAEEARPRRIAIKTGKVIEG